MRIFYSCGSAPCFRDKKSRRKAGFSRKTEQNCRSVSIPAQRESGLSSAQIGGRSLGRFLEAGIAGFCHAFRVSGEFDSGGLPNLLIGQIGDVFLIIGLVEAGAPLQTHDLAFLQKLERAVLNPDSFFRDAGDFPADHSLGKKRKRDLWWFLPIQLKGFRLKSLDYFLLRNGRQ